MKADFSKIITDSIEITKSNKKLWVFGFVLASLGAGANMSSGGNFDEIFKSTNNSKQDNNMEWKIPTKEEGYNQVQQLASDLPQVLGTSTDSLSTVIKSIPLSFYFILVGSVLFSLAIVTAISLYAKAWAQIGLIHGIDKQGPAQTLSLNQMSNQGKLNAVEVIKIQLIPTIMLTLVGAASLMLVALPVMFFGSVGKIIGLILGVSVVLALIVACILIAASTHLGIVAIGVGSLEWKVGFKKGYQVFTKFFFDILIMSFINCFAGCVVTAVMGIVLLVLGGIGLATVLGVAAFPPFMIAAGPIIFLILLALIIAMGLGNTALVVFKQSTWVLLYKQLMEEPNGQQ